MPSSNAKALEKAKTLPVDGIIFDLEDAVAPDAKPEAREAAAAAVAVRCVRRTRAHHPGQRHRHRVARRRPRGRRAAGPDVVLVPKVNTADEVPQLVAALEGAGAPEHTKLWAMIETPIGDPQRARDRAGLAAADARFVMGTNDLVKELYAEHVPGRAPSCPACTLRCSPPAPPAS